MRKLVIAGAGSLRTPGLIGALMNYKNEISVEELVLYDIDLKRAELVYNYVSAMVNEYSPNTKVTFTKDKVEAFTDAEYIFCQIRAGGDEMRSFDEKIPLKFGLVGQETCGAGGMAYGLRSIPQMIELVNDVRKINKKAWFLNFTNPAAVVGYALSSEFPNDDRIINMCDQPYSMLKSFAKILDVDFYDLSPRYFGLNHYGWFTGLTNKKGDDLFEKLRQNLLSTKLKPFNAEQRDQSWLDTYENVNKMMDFFPGYIPNTYLQYYFFTEDLVAKSNPTFTRVDEAKLSRHKSIIETCEKAKNYNVLGDDLPFILGDIHGNMMVEVASSIYNNLNNEFIIMKKNNGTVSNVADDALIEVAGTLDSRGVNAYNYGPIPTFYKGMIESQYAYEKLIYEGYKEKDEEKFIQALTINRAIVSPIKAKAVYDALKEVNKEYWFNGKK